MFMYIGDDQVIESKSIISILEFDLTTHSQRLTEIVKKHKKQKTLFGNQAHAKSIIITDDSVYYSPYSTYTLKNRDELFRSM